MKKGFYIVLLVCVSTMLWTSACSDKKPLANDTLVTDSFPDTTRLDTIEEILAEQPVPKAADELFDDFIFNFAGNRKQQLRRIKFPLPVMKGDETVYLSKNQWKIDRFFMEQNYYTLILDSRKQLNLPKDTSLNYVVLEKIYLDEHNVKKYHFNRIEGEWMLTSISEESFSQHANASFLDFYQRFATDSAFQAQSLNAEMEFSGPNPDNDFEELKGNITPEQWPAFSPGELPSGLIYNIIYGQKYKSSDRKIFLLRGISNGQEMEMTFRKIDDEWKLVKLVE